MSNATPRGFRDILPDEALARERISQTARECFSRHGYLPVETPLLESREALERGSRIDDTPFQLFDIDGGLLVIRPDLTLPIARMVSRRLSSASLPLRLRYNAPVVREESSLEGQPRQFTQVGVELVGGEGPVPEAEVVALLAEAFDALEVPAWRIVCGSVTPLKALLDNRVADPAVRAQVLELVHKSDFVGLFELVEKADLPFPVAHALREMVLLCGDASVLDTLDELLMCAGVSPKAAGTDELRDLLAALEGKMDTSRITFDFSIINSFEYYTGVIFKGYAAGIGAAVASGGRYDAVFERLGHPGVSACGFAFYLERLQEVLGVQGDSGLVTPGVHATERPLRIAVPKGSLFADTVSMLEAAGLEVDELRNPGRRMVIPAGDVAFVIVRAQDAPAFVAYGGADCGICGKDSLIEAGVDLLQLVDLGYGGCRFVVAEPADAKGKADAAYSWRGSVRVVTKYPRITQAYYDSIGQQVDIITLHGNIELGPMVGMADRIVDITATGTTLKENNLVVVDDVMECTARFFAGPAAWRLDARVRDLVTRLANASERED